MKQSPKRAGQVVRGGHGPRIVLAELILEAFVRLLIQDQCRLEVAQRAQVSTKAVRRHQRVRVIGPERSPLPFQYIGVEVPGISEAALGTQQVGDVELQVQGLLVLGAELVDPQILQPAGQG